MRKGLYTGLYKGLYKGLHNGLYKGLCKGLYNGLYKGLAGRAGALPSSSREMKFAFMCAGGRALAQARDPRRGSAFSPAEPQRVDASAATAPGTGSVHQQDRDRATVMQKCHCLRVCSHACVCTL